MLHYCTRCGRIIINSKKTEFCQCDFCKKYIPPVPEEFLENNRIFLKRELEQQFIKEYIESSPDFDPELQKARLERKKITDQQFARINQIANSENPAETERQLANPRKSNSITVECPYCHSTDTKKISSVSKGVSVGLFGIFGAGKVVKQWHCNSCKSDF